MGMERRHFAMALALSFVLGTGWIIGKAAIAHFPPIMVAALRFGLAGALILAWRGWPPVELRRLLPLSALAIGIPYSLSYLGLSRLDVSVTVLLVQLEAPILIVLSAIFLKEVPGRAAVLGTVLAVVGVLFVAGAPSADGRFGAVLVVIASMVVWALGQILVRRLGVGGGLDLLGALALLATPQLLALTLVFEADHLALVAGASLRTWLEVGYLGVGMTVAGVGTWYYLVARYPLHAVAPFLLLVPVVSVAGGVAVLGERLAPSTVLGGALIVAGVGLAALRRPANHGGEAAQEG